MIYLTCRARGRLNGIVERFWLVEDAESSTASETICPDGRTEIVLHLAEPMLETAAGANRRQPRHLLVGQMAAPITVMPTGRVSMVGARLAPGALRRMLPIPQDRIAGQVLDLDAIWRRWTRETVDRVGSTSAPAARFAALERALETLVPELPVDDEQRGIEIAVARLRLSGGTASIDRLSDEAGISRRQFERRFREYVGLPPRLFGRIVRFQRACHALGREDGAAIAARCGFADQAHLVHEIRRFSGQTPTLLTKASGLTAFFREA